MESGAQHVCSFATDDKLNHSSGTVRLVTFHRGCAFKAKQFPVSWCMTCTHLVMPMLGALAVEFQTLNIAFHVASAFFRPSHASH